MPYEDTLQTLPRPIQYRLYFPDQSVGSSIEASLTPPWMRKRLVKQIGSKRIHLSNRQGDLSGRSGQCQEANLKRQARLLLDWCRRELRYPFSTNPPPIAKPVICGRPVPRPYSAKGPLTR